MTSYDFIIQKKTVKDSSIKHNSFEITVKLIYNSFHYDANLHIKSHSVFPPRFYEVRNCQCKCKIASKRRKTSGQILANIAK